MEQAFSLALAPARALSVFCKSHIVISSRSAAPREEPSSNVAGSLRCLPATSRFSGYHLARAGRLVRTMPFS